MQPLEQRILDVIKRHLRSVLPNLDPELISADASLRDLGCNSIDRADVVTLTMEELDVTVPVSALAEVRDIRTLVHAIAQQMR